MRERIFSIILRGLEHWTPPPLASWQLQVLLNTTARAFSRPGPSVWYLPCSQALRKYARFTKRCLESDNASAQSLYRRFYALGQRLRKITGFTDEQKLQRLVFYLYRNIRISMSGQIPGTISISSCYFSNYYTPEQCRLMSYADSGLIAGLYSGGILEFSERITDGCRRCTACFTKAQCY